MNDLLNTTAPNIDLVDDSGTPWSLAEQRGKWVVVYFYPKDDTPGCTVEACSIRDASSGLSAINAVVVGISMDDAASHKKFKEKYNLSFALLSDPNKTAITAYNAWGPKMFGREGILRKTYIVDPEGVIKKIYARVTPLGHGDKLQADLSQLQTQ